MTMVERIASAIAASRAGSVASWRDFRAEAQRVIEACSTFPGLSLDGADETSGRSQHETSVSAPNE